MKKILTILLIILSGGFCPSLMAAQGLVIVLNAPLYQGPDVKSKTVGFVRQGSKIFIVDEDLDALARSPAEEENEVSTSNDVDVYVDEQTSEDPLNIEKEGQLYAPQDFYRTWDKLGRVAYIPKRYLKIIFNDERENGQPITLPSDETDYRLNDVLPPDYPLHRRHQHQFVVSFRTGLPITQHYAYPALVLERHQTWRQGMQFHWGTTLPFEQGYRRYFGLRFSYWGQSSRYLLANDVTAKESISFVGLGPYFAYTPFRRDDYNLEIQFSINLHLARSLIHQEQGRDYDERAFIGLPLSTALNIQWSMTNLLRWIDVVAAVEGEYFFGAHLKPTDKAYTPEWWENSPHHHRLDAHGQWAVLIGVGRTF
ncbi:MAG: hypothetical protein J6Y94_05615 [Bacteriovoracaceae bacterium]|nr:hypothetical protein [Bacteriovoracaceae bacterium]